LVFVVTQSTTQRRFSKLAAAINQKVRLVHAPGVKFDADDLAAIFIRDEGRCVYCGAELTLEGVSFDHVIPFDRGGGNFRSNVVACCMTCQHTKYTKSPQELAEWQMLIRVCRSCGNTFRPRWADFKRGFGFYCSRVCSGKAGGLA
jgi:HNH endonuclease